MRTPDPLPEALASLPFAVQDADLLGITRRRLRNGRVLSLGRGLRSLSLSPTSAELAGALSRVTTHAAASHTTAGHMWQFPHYSCESSDVIHISRPEGKPAMRRDGVIGHETKIFTDEVTVVNGVNVTTRERTWLDLAAGLLLHDLVVLADHLIRIPRSNFEGRTEPYSTPERLVATVDRHPGKRGVRRAREALALMRIGADSPQETLLRLALVEAGLPEPKLNLPIIDENGIEHHQPDQSYPEFRVGVEYDGLVHSDAEQVARDIARAEAYKRLAWVEVRISKRHMANDAKAAVAKIRSALVSAGWHPEPLSNR